LLVDVNALISEAVPRNKATFLHNLAGLVSLVDVVNQLGEGSQEDGI
jgi:hypothetical protein